jgi:hypothetical protein
MLGQQGRTVRVVESSGTERLQAGSLVRRVRNARRFYAACSREVRRGDVSDVVVCWPLFGFLDILFWATQARRRGARDIHPYLVVHDMRPPGRFKELRSWGNLLTGTLPERAARLVGDRVTIVVHTEAALAELQSRGWDRVICLPQPIGPAPQPPYSGGVRHALTVAGRYKPIRDVALLGELGRRRKASEGNYLISGDGWPEVPGWDVHHGFIPEEEFQRALRASRAVLIPYGSYSQSHVAMRAFEEGTPVVGIRHPQLEEMYGADYPGMVDELTADAVIAAMARVAEAPRERWLEDAEAYRRRAEAKWLGTVGASR